MVKKIENALIVSLNRGRGSGLTFAQHVDTIHESLNASAHIVSSELPKQIINAPYNFHQVNLGGKPIPVHEFLPTCHSQIEANKLSAVEAEEYINDYRQVVEKVVTTYKPEIMILHHANLSTVAAAESAKKSKTPYVVYVHGTCMDGYIDNENRDPTLWNRILASLEKANFLITASQYVRNSLVLPHINYPENKVVVIPPHLDDNFDRLSGEMNIIESEEQQKSVVYVGSMIESKGPQVLAEASAWYSDLAQTIFIGDGALALLIEAKGKNVSVKGFISEQEKVDILKSASVVVVPSQKNEHFGITVIEGMASCGVVIVPNYGGISEILEDGRTGIKIDCKNSVHLGKAVKTLLEDEELRLRIRKNAKTSVRKNFSKGPIQTKIRTVLENSLLNI